MSPKRSRTSRSKPDRVSCRFRRRYRAVLTGHYFHRLPRARSVARHAELANLHVYLRHLSDRIVARFARFSSLKVLPVLLDLSPGDDMTPPTHPACVEFEDTIYCRESWELHKGQLKRRLETHWHKCDYGRLCAIVPLVYRGQCLAIFKLACGEPTTESDFKHDVELLDMVVENVGLTEAASLVRFFADGPAPTAVGRERTARRPHRKSSGRGSSHSQVVRALEYIEHALSDHDLTVSHVARKVGLHSDYLAHLFAEEVGERMSRYIACRRIERAKNLLVTTNWSVERVASESGFGNPKWFYHVFHTHTGQTPAGYRRQQREPHSDKVRIS